MKTIVFVIFSLIVIGGYGKVVGSESVVHNSQVSSCQYPVRPLNPDGSCDNSDPCDTTTIKDPELHGNCKPVDPKPLEQEQKFEVFYGK